MGHMERRAHRFGELAARAVPDGVAWGSWHENCAGLGGLHILSIVRIALAAYTARGVVKLFSTVFDLWN